MVCDSIHGFVSMSINWRSIVLALCCGLAGGSHGQNLPQRNPFLADSHCGMGHCDSAQQNSIGLAGPGGPGKGWIRNGFAVDSDNGIYLVSQDYLHKVVWTGEGLSVDEADGAWSEPYINEDDIGSGSTPSLMGFGEEDALVVITDGQRHSNG